MEYLWLILAVICAIIGIIGSVIPMLPGPPISYVAVWMMWLRNSSDVSPEALWITGIIMAAITIIDYLAPIWLTKLGGGSKQSTRGATIGLIIGIFFCGPLGMIICPFIGALIGELTINAHFEKALKVASLSFLAFLLTTGLKLIYCVGIVIFILKLVLPTSF